MPNALDKEEILRQSLVDAGCDEKLITECMRRFRDGTLDGILPKLTAHRKCVLSDVHKGQKQIDCLDYLTNKIKSNEYKEYRKEKSSC